MDKKFMKKEKGPLLEFELQVKDIRAQFSEQLKCLDVRAESQVYLLAELSDYYRRRAEIEVEYGKSLEKLAKQVSTKQKADKAKQDTWAQQLSLYTLWQEVMTTTRTEAKQRSTLGELYNGHVTSRLQCHGDNVMRITKKCKEIAVEAQNEIVRVLGELHTAMKTYQVCHGESINAETKFKAIEMSKLKFEDAFPKKLGTRKHRLLEKEFEKKQSKYQEFKLKALMARNEYLLCVDAANAALHKYYADDVSDLLDCMDVGLCPYVASTLLPVTQAGQCLVESSQAALSGLTTWLDALDPRVDKQRFLEANQGSFMLPKRLEFHSHKNDEIKQVSAQKTVQDDLIQRYSQLSQRLMQLKTETEEVWKTLETTEKTLLNAIKTPEPQVEDAFRTIGSGLSAASGDSRRTSLREIDKSIDVAKRRHDLSEMEEFYLNKFREYCLTSNLIARLSARHKAIQAALGIPRTPSATPSPDPISQTSQRAESAISSVTTSTAVANGRDDCRCPPGTDPLPPVPTHVPVSHQSSAADIASMATSQDGRLSDCSQALANRPPLLPPKPRKKRIGRSGARQAPKLFGGSLDEYVEVTGQEIPLIIRSCIRMLSLFGLHHQGVFRVSGSQIEINAFKDSFEKGEDPLECVTDASDVNSVAGVLKLYFRELREPLFPMFMFEQFINCVKVNTAEDFIDNIRELLFKLPRANFVAMRYLFAFLNHLSEFSDENMMDPYNLAICFGPTLMPIPESRDQVFYHNHVNDLMKNMLIYQDEIFPNDGGIVYEKYLFADHGDDKYDANDLIVTSDDEMPMQEGGSLEDLTDLRDVPRDGAMTGASETPSVTSQSDSDQVMSQQRHQMARQHSSPGQSRGSGSGKGGNYSGQKQPYSEDSSPAAGLTGATAGTPSHGHSAAHSKRHPHHANHAPSASRGGSQRTNSASMNALHHLKDMRPFSVGYTPATMVAANQSGVPPDPSNSAVWERRIPPMPFEFGPEDSQEPPTVPFAEAITRNPSLTKKSRAPPIPDTASQPISQHSVVDPAPLDVDLPLEDQPDSSPHYYHPGAKSQSTPPSGHLIESSISALIGQSNQQQSQMESPLMSTFSGGGSSVVSAMSTPQTSSSGGSNAMKNSPLLRLGLTGYETPTSRPVPGSRHDPPLSIATSSVDRDSGKGSEISSPYRDEGSVERYCRSSSSDYLETSFLSHPEPMARKLHGLSLVGGSGVVERNREGSSMSKSSISYQGEGAAEPSEGGEKPSSPTPTALKEIQVELKAVLNSLETFTAQSKRQHQRLSGGSTGSACDFKFTPGSETSPGQQLPFRSSPAPFPADDSVEMMMVDGRSAGNEAGFTVAPPHHSSNAAPPPPAPYSWTTQKNQPQTNLYTPDLVQNLPTGKTATGSDGESPCGSSAGSLSGGESGGAGHQYPLKASQQTSIVYRGGNDYVNSDISGNTSSDDCQLLDPGSAAGNRLSSAAERFAEENQSTLKKVGPAADPGGTVALRPAPYVATGAEDDHRFLNDSHLLETTRLLIESRNSRSELRPASSNDDVDSSARSRDGTLTNTEEGNFWRHSSNSSCDAAQGGNNINNNAKDRTSAINCRMDAAGNTERQPRSTGAIASLASSPSRRSVGNPVRGATNVVATSRFNGNNLNNSSPAPAIMTSSLTDSSAASLTIADRADNNDSSIGFRHRGAAAGASPAYVDGSEAPQIVAFRRSVAASAAAAKRESNEGRPGDNRKSLDSNQRRSDSRERSVNVDDSASSSIPAHRDDNLSPRFGNYHSVDSTPWGTEEGPSRSIPRQGSVPPPPVKPKPLLPKKPACSGSPQPDRSLKKLVEISKM